MLDEVPGPAFVQNPAAGPVNGSLRSISCEFWCYIGVLLCGVAGWLMRRRLIWTISGASVLVSLAFRAFDLHSGGSYLGLVLGYPPFWARLLPFFLVGMAFHAVGGDRWLNGRGALLCTVGLGGASFVPHALLIVLPLAVAYLLFWLAVLPVPRLSNFGRYGDFSYGIYLYSFPILQIVVALHGGPMDPLGLFLMAWPLSVAGGFLNWHLVECRFLRKKSSAHLSTSLEPPTSALDLSLRS